jgi:hypothetical protein
LFTHNSRNKFLDVPLSPRVDYDYLVSERRRFMPTTSPFKIPQESVLDTEIKWLVSVIMTGKCTDEDEKNLRQAIDKRGAGWATVIQILLSIIQALSTYVLRAWFFCIRKPGRRPGFLAFPTYKKSDIESACLYLFSSAALTYFDAEASKYEVRDISSSLLTRLLVNSHPWLFTLLSSAALTYFDAEASKYEVRDISSSLLTRLLVNSHPWLFTLLSSAALTYFDAEASKYEVRDISSSLSKLLT